ENRDLRCVLHSVSAHQLDVSMRDRQNARASPRRSRYCPDLVPSVLADYRMPRKEANEMLRNTDWSHSRATAAVRNAERLVKVQVADIGANVRRPAQADHRVHVRAVHVHLATVLVDDLANLDDRFLEHAVSR